MSKIRVGIIFGGQSKEREISFAGGRTVYDNLNKSNLYKVSTGKIKSYKGLKLFNPLDP